MSNHGEDEEARKEKGFECKLGGALPSYWTHGWKREPGF
jgi:hypothetical protein